MEDAELLRVPSEGGDITVELITADGVHALQASRDEAIYGACMRALGHNTTMRLNVVFSGQAVDEEETFQALDAHP